MTFGSILVLAVGLAMDATAAAGVRGSALPRIEPRHVLLVALFFGGFQALMPVIGWVVGAQLGPLVEAWDHWIAFVLLAGIGGKMLWDARGGDDDDAPDATLDLRTLLLLAVATSIDALAVGVTLPIIGAPLLLSVVTIGVTAAVASVLGLFVGHRFGAQLGSKLDVVGGLVLIGLGLKILAEHTL